MVSNNEVDKELSEGKSSASSAVVFEPNNAEVSTIRESTEDLRQEVSPLSGEVEKADKPGITHRILVIHDKDQDGYCAANIIKQYKKQPTVAVGLVAFGHGRDIRAVVVDPDKWDEIFIVDLVVPLSYIRDLLLNGFKVTIIDHHQTTIDNLMEFSDPNFCAYVGDAYSATGLTWKFLYNNTEFPWIVKMINDWDIWNHEDPQVIPFHFGMECIDMNDWKIWKTLLKGDPASCSQIMQMGQLVGAYWVNSMNEITAENGYVIEKNGIKFYACNGNFRSSYDFASTFDETKHDAMMWYSYTPNHDWKVSMRTTKEGIDLLPIVAQYGGGGHKQSCGCNLSNEQIKEWFPADLNNSSTNNSSENT
jgi:oligoribonuclease NrnB/cAMP/cGMP phosphodiesterase (DHH superfamily)